MVPLSRTATRLPLGKWSKATRPRCTGWPHGKRELPFVQGLVDMTRSASRRRTTDVCAQPTAGANVKRSWRIHSLVNVAKGCI